MNQTILIGTSTKLNSKLDIVRDAINNTLQVLRKPEPTGNGARQTTMYVPYTTTTTLEVSGFM